MNKKWVEMKNRYWPPKKDQLLILILSGLLLAVIAIPVDQKEQENKEKKENIPAVSETSEAVLDYESQMEQKLEELLGSVDGVGKVKVMLTFEGTGEKKVEKDHTLAGEETREETVYEEKGSSERTPYVTAETNPKVEGVLVIAEGGGNSRIKQEILEAAQALFGIKAHKIKIMKMEGIK